LEKFKDEDPTLDGSRELMFLEIVMKSIEEKKIEDFEQVLFDYNKITPFDKLKTKILVKIKEGFKKEEIGAEGGLA
jgi:hypothetical protein